MGGSRYLRREGGPSPTDRKFGAFIVLTIFYRGSPIVIFLSGGGGVILFQEVGGYSEFSCYIEVV